MQRPSPNFRSEEYFVHEIFEETFYPNLSRLVWRRHAGAHLDEHQHGGRKPAETSVTEFCYKTVILGENNQKISFIDYYITNCLRRHFKKL